MRVRTLLLREGLVVGLATGYGFLSVFAYDRGFCDHFQIPIEFISVSATNLVCAAVVAAALFVTLPSLLPVPGSYVTKLNAADWIVTASAGLLIAWILVGIPPNWYWPSLLAVPLAGTIATGVFVLLAYRLERRRDFGQQVTFPAVKAVSVLSVFLARDIAKTVVLLAGSAVITSLVAYFYGAMHAANYTYHSVTVENQPKVILAVFGANAIAARYYPALGGVDHTFTIYEVGKDLPSFTVEDTGPLRSL